MLRMIAASDPEADVAEARRCKAEGYVAFKIKVGTGEPRADAEAHASRVRSARRRPAHFRRCEPGLDGR